MIIPRERRSSWESTRMLYVICSSWRIIKTVSPWMDGLCAVCLLLAYAHHEGMETEDRVLNDQKPSGDE